MDVIEGEARAELLAIMRSEPVNLGPLDVLRGNQRRPAGWVTLGDRPDQFWGKVGCAHFHDRWPVSEPVARQLALNEEAASIFADALSFEELVPLAVSRAVTWEGQRVLMTVSQNLGKPVAGQVNSLKVISDADLTAAHVFDTVIGNFDRNLSNVWRDRRDTPPRGLFYDNECGFGIEMPHLIRQTLCSDEFNRRGLTVPQALRDRIAAVPRLIDLKRLGQLLSTEEIEHAIERCQALV